MARYDDMVLPGGVDDDDSDDEIGGSGAHHKAKPRRKSHQRPQGSDQIRQAFSKRKKGLVLKAYQLNALTDAKVFMFIVNDKGTSWAYATPGFSSSLNPDLLKELRMLAQVPEQAKLSTEVMSDPPNAKQTDTVAGAEHPAMRRPDQVPGYVAPATRTSTGAIPARSRSSYSGGTGGEGYVPGPSERMPLVRSGSTTTSNARMHSMMQSDEHSPTKPHARPPSGSSMACGGRPGSAVAQSQYLQQQQQQRQQQHGGKLIGTSMEPPTPCGVYNLLGQPVAASDSPTVVSELAASSASPSSRPQQQLPPEIAAGVRLAAAVNAAGTPISMKGLEQQQQAQAQVQQQQCWQQQANMQWVPQQANWNLGMYQQQAAAATQQYQQQQYQQQQYQQQQQQQQQQQYQPVCAADGWVTVEVSNPQQQQYHAGEYSSAAAAVAECQLMRMCSTNSTRLPAGANTARDGRPAACWSPLPEAAAGNIDSCQQQQQQQRQALAVGSNAAAVGAATAGAANTTGSSEPGEFESMLRGLPPLRLTRPTPHPNTDWRDGDGTHSAPAGAVNSTLGRPSQWMEFEVKPEHLRVLSDAGCYGASSSGYSSYGPSPSYAVQQAAGRTNASSPVDGQGASPGVAAGSGAGSATASMVLVRDAASADPSPTAALSRQMCSMLAMESPLHPSAAPIQQQQQLGQTQGGYYNLQQQPGQLGSSWTAGDAAACVQEQAIKREGSAMAGFQQQHNQGAYMPRTDDLVSDPLMDMLMDQAVGGMGSRPAGHQQQQQQQQHHGQHGQQHLSIMEATLNHPPTQQQQQQQQQHSPQYYVASQQFSQQQQHGQLQQMGASGMVQGMAVPALPSQQGQQQDLAQLQSMLMQYIPLPPKSEADKPAWVEQAKQILAHLQLQPQQREQLRAMLDQQLAAKAGVGAAAVAAGVGNSGSNVCSPVLPSSNISSSTNPSGLGAAGGAGSYIPRVAVVPGAAQGGKQRHGPSRLSATSQAGEYTAAAGQAADAEAVPGNLVALLMDEDEGGFGCGVAGSGRSGPSGYPSGLSGPCQQMRGAAEAAAMPLPVSCMPMSLPLLVPVAGVAVSTATAGYAVQAVTGQPVSGPMAACCTSMGGVGYGCGSQMMPMPSSIASMGQQQQQQQLRAVSNPVLLAASSPAAAASGAASAVCDPAAAARSAGCSSPLKRCQPSVFGIMPGLGEPDEAMSPLKRACRELPEPPSFATLLQTELGEDDAVAWAASAAANDSLRMAGSCGSFLKFDSLGGLAKYGSGGSLPGFVTVGGGEAAAAQMAAAAGSSGGLVQQLVQRDGGNAAGEDVVMGMGELEQQGVVVGDAGAGVGAGGDATAGADGAGGDPAAAGVQEQVN